VKTAAICHHRSNLSWQNKSGNIGIPVIFPHSQIYANDNITNSVPKTVMNWFWYFNIQTNTNHTKHTVKDHSY